ncbi:putative hydroxypyruvate isomerase isoform X2 [Saimiri boliviensis]|uniref:putative hydroxypyruvate isomerase isoform X2 n=1 Tax=Saimiri boliviensis TaxID=27679 RepID=UPI000533DC63|nr:putative hydroxypyruvate isomerase isoform X2 [Saimiri boliviensis boliviensis]
MAPLRFSANLSWLFPELPGLLARLQAAGSSGFEAAEVAWPYAEPPEALARAAQEAGLRLVLINTPPGARQAGRAGGAGACVPELRAEARSLCRRSREGGNGAGGRTRETGGLPRGAGAGGAVRQGPGLSQEDLVGLLEPINTRITDPQYFLDTPQQAAAILQKVGRPNLQLQMDIFHWQIMDGNLTGNIREFLPIVGHVQVAQVPGRGEPSSPGELNFPYLFQLLEDEGYKGFVGCEYRPQGDTVEGLSWLRSYWDRRGHPEAGQ